MAVLYGLAGMPAGQVRVIAAWKEAILVLLLGLVCVRSILGLGPRTRITVSDLCAAGLISLAACFVLAQNVLLLHDLSFGGSMLGFRDAVFLLTAYFLGRGMPELVSDPRTLRRLYILLVFTCLVAVVEMLFVSPEMLVLLGVTAYFQDFLGVAAFTVGNDYGLPLNYWTIIAGRAIRRAGSVYLGGQGFAVPFIIFFPVATAFVFARAKRSGVALALYPVVCLGLLLTFTRMTTLVALIQVMLFVVLLKRPEWAVAGLVVAGSLFLAAMVAVPGFPTFVWHTLSWQEGSSVSHLKDWTQGIVAFVEHPWGAGLGTTDQTAVRLGLVPLTADNLYLKYGVEMGVAGLLLFLGLMGSIAASSLAVFRQGASEEQRRMGMVVWLATIGILMNGITGVVFNSVILAILFFWLAGATVTARDMMSAPELASPELIPPARAIA